MKPAACFDRRAAGLAGLQLGWLLALSCAGPGAPAPAPEIALVTDPRFAEAADYSASHAGHAFLVLEGEEVVYEAGHNGHDPAAPHALHAGTESFWGLLAVAAECDGLIDLDEPVVLTLPEFQADPWKRDMRIRQLLHYTSGLESGFEALSRGEASDPFARALQLEMVSRPGERFQYGPSHLFVFGELLRRKLEAAGQEPDPLVYLRRRLLEPIGLGSADWQGQGAGQPDPISGARLTAREWARFGRLLARRGRWDGEELVAPEAVAACFEGSEANPAYGLTLWLNPPAARRERTSSWRVRDAPHAFYPGGLPELAVAAGHHNQRLYVIPSLDLVVVRFGGRDRGFRDEDLLARLVGGAGGDARPP